ncbi:MAG: cytochrome c oxidase subunit II [Solirubrobacteraceae bacterium]|nr:cytochrome c oxidase subunit II [Solirubrobacteraceae bacterium]
MAPTATYPNFRRTLTAALVLAAMGLMVFAGAASADLMTPESGGSPNADDIDTLYKLVLVVAFVIFFGVEGILLYSLIKYRHRKGAVAAQIHGNTKLEIGWTVGAAVILVVLGGFTFAMLGDIRNPPDSSANGFDTGRPVASTSSADRQPPNGKSLRIQVNGQQYAWRFTYGDSDKNKLNDVFSYNTMVVPTKTTVTLTIVAQDVIHSWWIPELGGKFDAVPGHKNYTWFKIDKPGVYRGQCAELCGRNHANMIAFVKAVEPEEYQQWLAGKKLAIAAANKEAAVQRKTLSPTGDRVAAAEAPDAPADATPTP